MLCPACGSQMNDNARSCPSCGALTGSASMGTSALPGAGAVKAPQYVPAAGQKVTENIYLCPDGVYRWVYEFKMMRNPTILFTIMKIFGAIIGGIYLFMIILSAIEGDLSTDGFLQQTFVFALIFAGMTVLVFFSYLIVAAHNGWKYIVLFEMDNNGITHTQMQSQFERAQAINWLIAAAGLISGSPTLAGAGINAAVNNSIHSDFSKVKSVRVKRRSGVIKVNEMLYKNQVYTEPADFDFVLGFIKQHVNL